MDEKPTVMPDAALPRPGWQRLRARVFGTSRGHAVTQTALMSLATRGIVILSLLISIPLMLHSFGHERYGVWMAATALATFFTIADGGVTNGMVSPVAAAFGVRDFERIRVLISSALAATLVLCSSVLAGVLLLTPLVDWTWLFNVSDPAIGREAEQVIAILCACYALSFPATVIRHGPSPVSVRT